MKKNIRPILAFFILIIFIISCHEDSSTLPSPVPIPAMVKIKTSVKITVGDIVYENLDAQIRVKGYGSLDDLRWEKDFSFIGPLSELEIQNGFHHYSIELVDKWGINDIQSGISGKDIWDGRADGPLPITYDLAGSKKAKKLSMYVTSNQSNAPGTVYSPESRVLYTYHDNGRLENIHHEIYNSETSQFEREMTDAFTFDGSSVSKIVRTLSAVPLLFIEYHYEYGVENKITEINHFTEITSTQITTRHHESDPGNSRVSVNWSYSNGSSFLYEFDVLFKNLIRDKTIRQGQLCNQGTYTYDKYINPFRHLGYVDSNLRNWPINNRVTESIDYKACSFPANRVPVSYSYTYDQDGYPTKKIITYKSSSPNELPYFSEVKFYYE